MNRFKIKNIELDGHYDTRRIYDKDDYFESWLNTVAAETGLSIEAVKQIAEETENLEDFWLKISTSQRK
jgi:hypothetical protein